MEDLGQWMKDELLPCMVREHVCLVTTSSDQEDLKLSMGWGGRWERCLDEPVKQVTVEQV